MPAAFDSEFDATPNAATDPAEVTLYLLEKVRASTPRAREEFAPFVAQSLAHGLAVVGSDYSVEAIQRALEAMAKRSPRIFHAHAHSRSRG